jgi:hypothetical protein
MCAPTPQGFNKGEKDDWMVAEFLLKPVPHPSQFPHSALVSFEETLAYKKGTE